MSLRIALVLAVCASSGVFAQDPASGTPKNIYETTAPAVFLVETRDSLGDNIGIGTAFLITGNRLITNAHVISGGMPYLKVGAVALPLKTERLDAENDLAVLTLPSPLEAEPLRLGEGEVDIGTAVFAIGNPHGLERTISQGIVSGRRDVDGRRLVQITAPISPGSSGGPVVNSAGTVVGVIVGFFREGQNLNFAVPVDIVRGLMSATASPGFATAALNARALISQGAPSYSDRSAWSQYQSEVDRAVDLLASAAVDAQQFLESASLAARLYELDHAARFATEALARGTMHADSARVLLIEGWQWDVLLQPDSLTQAQLVNYLAVADTVLSNDIDRASVHLFRARVLGALGRPKSQILAAARNAIDAAGRTEADPDRYLSAQHTLAAAHGTAAEDDAAFDELVDAIGGDEYDWSAHAEHLDDRKEWKRAAEAFTKAYVASDGTDLESLCKSVVLYWSAQLPDDALAVARLCIEGYALAESVDTSHLSIAHLLISTILEERGVYSTAEVHARQAVQLAPENAWAVAALAQALIGSERYTEAVAAAERAIRLSDGRHSAMHFALGSAYFELKEWSRCEKAFQRAFELDPEETSAAYNTALCLARQAYYSDAARWMEKVLAINPRHPDRADIEAQIRRWRR